MSEEERFKLENELLMTKSKAQMINLYIDKLDQLQQKENIIKEVREYIESFNLPKDLGVLGEAPISISELKHILEILDKLDKEDK